ncbi:hypothetical protein D3C85_1332520 [compost metagenome]
MLKNMGSPFGMILIICSTPSNMVNRTASASSELHWLRINVHDITQIAIRLITDPPIFLTHFNKAHYILQQIHRLSWCHTQKLCTAKPFDRLVRRNAAK